MWGRTDTPPAKLSACATCHAAHRGGEPLRASGEPPRAMARRRACVVSKLFGCNGGRARCPHRAARVIRVGSGVGCGHGARGGRWRTGAPRGMVTVSHGEGCERDAGCQAAHRAEARRRDGDIAPYRNGTGPRGTRGARRWDRTTGHEGCARRWDRSTGTAKPRTARRCAVRQGGAKVLRRQFCGGVSYSRRLRDGFPSPLNPKSFSFFRNTLWQIELF